jgi:cytochrome c oxidase assembly factor CtaG
MVLLVVLILLVLLLAGGGWRVGTPGDAGGPPWRSVLWVLAVVLVVLIVVGGLSGWYGPRWYP